MELLTIEILLLVVGVETAMCVGCCGRASEGRDLKVQEAAPHAGYKLPATPTPTTYVNHLVD